MKKYIRAFSVAELIITMLIVGICCVLIVPTVLSLQEEYKFKKKNETTTQISDKYNYTNRIRGTVVQNTTIQITDDDGNLLPPFDAYENTTMKLKARYTEQIICKGVTYKMRLTQSGNSYTISIKNETTGQVKEETVKGSNPTEAKDLTASTLQQLRKTYPELPKDTSTAVKNISQECSYTDDTDIKDGEIDIVIPAATDKTRKNYYVVIKAYEPSWRRQIINKKKDADIELNDEDKVFNSGKN